MDLLSFEDVCTTFEGDVPLGGDLTAAYLYRHSIYGELVSAEDLHIQVRLILIMVKVVSALIFVCECSTFTHTYTHRTSLSQNDCIVLVVFLGCDVRAVGAAATLLHIQSRLPSAYAYSLQ